jgi:fructokinase
MPDGLPDKRDNRSSAMVDAPMIAGLELGGTKCVAILASGPDDVMDEVRIPTTTPGETLDALERALARWGGFAAIGVGSFGPVAVDPAATDYGFITTTPKPGWAHTDVVGRLRATFGVPVGFHTDVVGAALAEGQWGAAAGLPDHAYVTIGTGVGVGLVAAGRALSGMTHPELGHLRPPRMRGDDWIGACPFHGDCVEGLASGPAIAARTGVRAQDLPADHPAWEPVAHALAQLCHGLVMTGVPRRIVIGGGVGMGVPHLLPRIRRLLHDSVAGYVVTAELNDLNTFVVPPHFGERAGPLGSIVLGQQALSLTTL